LPVGTGGALSQQKGGGQNREIFAKRSRRRWRYHHRSCDGESVASGACWWGSGKQTGTRALTG